MNKAGGNDQDSVLGIFLVTLSAVIQGSIQIAVRTISIYGVPWLLRPAYVGIFSFIFSMGVMIILPDAINIYAYTMTDILFLSLSALGCALCIANINLAFRYASASRLTPINYIENVFTLLSDFLVFGYRFVETDYIGMGIISV